MWDYEPIELEYSDTANAESNGKVPLQSLNKKKKLQQVIPPIPTPDEPAVFDGFLVNNGDHIIVDDYYTFLNYTYFNETLLDLPGFAGFAPRSLYPSAFVSYEEQNSTYVLLVIDTEHE
jgi:hypothetical protein